jgi:hypothetical protein
MMTLVENVTTDVTNVKEQLKTVQFVLESENSLSTLKQIFQTNVSVHPTFSKVMMEVAKNVILNVLNVPVLMIIVTLVLMTESKELNQTAHAQVINLKMLKDIVKNVHIDVQNV